MQQDRKPNWNKWRYVLDVRIWEAVALSLNIAPEQVEHHPQSWMVDEHLFDESDDFRDRVFVASRNLAARSGLTPRMLSMDDPTASLVSLAQFTVLGSFGEMEGSIGVF